MARQLVEKYIFYPDVANAGYVKFPGKVDATQLLIIANKTSQNNIYAIGDPTRGGVVTYNATEDAGFFSEQEGVTTVTFGFDTSSMSSTDKIAIYTDAPKQIGNIVRPYAFGVDAIERMRVSNPQSLIDADFEYGLQPTKWQNYSDIRNIPGIYEKPGLDLFLSDITTNAASPSVITVTTSAPHGLSVNDPVILFGLTGTTNYARAEGSFVISSVPTSTTFTYFAKGIVGVSGNPGTSIYSASSYGRRGGFYAGSDLPIESVSSSEANPSVITVTCFANHGLVPGAPLVGIATSAGTNHGLLTGNFFAESVPTPLTFTFTARVGGAVATSAIVMSMYTRSDAFVIHRPFDGGVTLGAFVPSHGASISRQTKKYMRYQSGKGILWTSGVLFNPVMNLDQISANGTAAGSIITVSTELDHGLQVGAVVEIAGVVTSGYNGTYGINTITNENTFTLVAAVTLGSTTAVITNLPRVTLKNWHGASVRMGPFDDQNGLFWEFDGKELAVVKRSATYQLSGFCTVTPGSQAVNASSGRFTQQLKVGDRIVIRGMTYMVGSIASDNALTINPAYRGVNVSTGIKLSTVIDTRIGQSEFNIDKLDGTGISGYNINLNKMQMMGIAFSWYGAGFIDFMCRGSDGNMILAHRMKQNNINDEAYMRSGNSTVRYQTINESVIGTLADSIANNSTTIPLADVSRFPANGGTVLIQNECINFTGINLATNSLTNCTRGATFDLFVGGVNKSFTGGAATNHNYGNGRTSVTLISCSAAPTLNHWGSSYIMDGGFDQDRGYYFSYSALNQTIPTGDAHTVFFIRLAPSVSNSISGTLGDRDLLNRSQLLLQKLQVQSDQSVQVYGILNPGNVDSGTDLSWQSVNTVTLGSQPSFAQVAEGVTYASTPGEQIFSTLGQPDGFSEIDLSSLKELSNSAIGGYGNFPDGPDVLGIVVKNLTIGTTLFEVTKTTTDSSSKYRINGYNNPTLTVYRGQTYTFNLASSTLNGTVAVSGTGGQFTCGASTLAVGDRIRITGALGGTATITGYVTGTEYKVSAITGSGSNVTGFTLTTTADVAIVTTAGTLTGLTYTTNNPFGIHPFWIKTAQSIGTGDSYNTGVTNNGANYGQTIIWTVDIDAPDTLYYNCQLHTADRGTITVLDRAPANVNVNLFWSEAQA
jgi:hypothetical protein